LLFAHPNDTFFGGWRYDSSDNRIAGLGDVDGDGKVEVLITSDWGIGVLKQRENTFDSLVCCPNDTWFGGWRYDSRNNRIMGLADVDGDGRVEVLMTSDWEIGVLKQRDGTFDSLVVAPNGTLFGNWCYAPNDRIVGLGDVDGDRKVEVLITSDWGVGVLKQHEHTFHSMVCQPNGTRFGGWLFASSTDRIRGAGDFDGDGREEFLVTSPWGMGLLSLLADSLWCPDLRSYGNTIGNWFLVAGDTVVGIGKFTPGVVGCSSRRGLVLSLTLPRSYMRLTPEGALGVDENGGIRRLGIDFFLVGAQYSGDLAVSNITHSKYLSAPFCGTASRFLVGRPGGNRRHS
jgi:hypothetical protein